MFAANLARRLGNEFYKSAFPVYRPLYHAFKRYADRSERRLLAGHLLPGDIVVDAGANIGIYSQFLAGCVGPTGQVHSFEPDPKNFARLRNSLAGNPNVQVNQLALSDRTGESLLDVSEALNVDHRAYATTGESRKTLVIRSTALDDYFPPGTRVDLIKMDIQGYELHALMGAERVLTDNPGIMLLLEFWPYGLKQAGGSGQALISFLRQRGFSLSVQGDDGRATADCLLATRSDVSTYLNLFAHREAASAA